jgi:hypothetical protein
VCRGLAEAISQWWRRATSATAGGGTAVSTMTLIGLHAGRERIRIAGDLFVYRSFWGAKINCFDRLRSSAQPFTWTAKPKEIIAKVRVLQRDYKRLIANNSK